MIPIWKETLFFSGFTRLAVTFVLRWGLNLTVLMEDVGRKLTVTSKS